MKTILTGILLILMPYFTFSQTVDTVFTSQQVSRIAYVIDSLKLTATHFQNLDKINTSIIAEKDKALYKAGEIYAQQSLMIRKQEEQINILNDSLKRAMASQKKSFIKAPLTWYSLGALSVITLALLVK